MKKQYFIIGAMILIMMASVFALQRIGGLFEDQGIDRKGLPPNVVILSESFPSAVTGSYIPITIKIKNTGGDMTETWIIEAQPKKISSRAAALFQGICDFRSPQNTHIGFKLIAGETETLNFNVPVVEGNGIYQIELLSVASCCNSARGCSDTLGPYGWGSSRILAPIDVSAPAPIQKCSDGTPYGICSNTAGKYQYICRSGTLESACTFCGGCPSGTACSTATEKCEPICVPDWQTGSWNTCSSSGVQTRTVTDAKNCGTNSGKPATSQSCTPSQVCPSVCVPMYEIKNNQCSLNECGSGCGPNNTTTFKTQQECINVLSGTTPIIKFGVPEPSVPSIIEKAPADPAPTFEIIITNLGNTKTGTNLEALYISKSSSKYDVFKGIPGGNIFAFLGIEGVTQRTACQAAAGEGFVQAVIIDPIEVGASKSIKLNPSFPSQGDKFADNSSNYASDGAYLLFVGTFNKCGEGHTGAVAKHIQIVEGNASKKLCYYAGDEWKSDNLNLALKATNNFISVFNFFVTKFGLEPKQYIDVKAPESITITEGCGYIPANQKCSDAGGIDATDALCAGKTEPKVSVVERKEPVREGIPTMTDDLLSDFDKLTGPGKNDFLNTYRCQLSTECLEFPDAKCILKKEANKVTSLSKFFQKAFGDIGNDDHGFCVKEKSLCDYFDFLDESVGEENSCAVGILGIIFLILIFFAIILRS